MFDDSAYCRTLESKVLSPLLDSSLFLNIISFVVKM
jgi:hypothetical protein